jgi:hypothetical protein
MDVEALRTMNKKLPKKYHAFSASESVIKQIPRVLGPGLNKAGKRYVQSSSSYLFMFLVLIIERASFLGLSIFFFAKYTYFLDVYVQ